MPRSIDDATTGVAGRARPRWIVLENAGTVLGRRPPSRTRRAYNARVLPSSRSFLSWLTLGILAACGSGTEADSTADGMTAASTGNTDSSASGSPGTMTAMTPSTSGSSADDTGPTPDPSGDPSSSSDSTGEEGRDLGPERDEFFGESRCDESGLLVCDGFEGGEIDQALWEIAASGGNVVEIVGDQSARGDQSVHIHTNNGFGFLRNLSAFPIESDRYWGRMFIRFDRFSTVAWAHWTIGEGAGEGDGSLIRVGGQYNTNQGVNRWGVGSDGGPTGDWTTHDQDPDGAPQEPPEDTWICVEWLQDGSTDEALFFVDAVEHPSLATTSDMHGGNDVPYDLPSFRSVWFGWWQYQSDPQPFDVWIDEIAIDPERMGCKI